MTHDEIRKRLEKLLSQVDSPEPWTSRQQMLDLIGEAFGAVKTIPSLLDEIKSLIVSRTDVLRENETLIEEVRAGSERIAALTTERDSCQRMLEDLTPGGSEFYRNPIRCRNWVQDRLSSAHASTVKAVQERDDALARLAAAEALYLDAVDGYARAEHQDYCGEPHTLQEHVDEAVAEARAALAGSREQTARSGEVQR